MTTRHLHDYGELSDQRECEPPLAGRIYDRNEPPSLREWWFVIHTSPTSITMLMHAIAAQLTAAIYPGMIKLGQTWTRGGGAVEDPAAPKDGFHFKTYRNMWQLVVLFTRIDSSARAIYVSQNELISQGTHTIVPSKAMAIWIGERVESGTMMEQVGRMQVKLDTPALTDVHFRGPGPKIITYDASGRWQGD